MPRPSTRNASIGFPRFSIRLVMLATIGSAIGFYACSGDDTSPSKGTAGTGGDSNSGNGGSSGESGSAQQGGSGGGQGNSGGSQAAGNNGGSAGSAATGGSGGSGGSGGATNDDGGAAGSKSDAGACKPDLGYTLQFHGTGDDRVHANITKLPINQEARTIELWAYFDGSNNSWRDEHGLFEYGMKSSCSNGQCCHEFGINSVGWNGNGPGAIHPYGNCPEIDNSFTMPADVMKTGWVHVSFSYDAAAKQFHFTVNGDDMIQGRNHPIGNWPGSTFSTMKSELRIGTTDDFSGPPGWQGKIDELRVWNVYRTPQQIRDNMRVILKGTEPGLVAYYHFDEGMGQSSKDATGDANNDAIFVGSEKATWPMWVKSDIPGTWTCAP